MAGYTYGRYGEVVAFLKEWLTEALKDGGNALAFACLTGVQRISKESIFSDLNNMTVSSALDAEADERFGFTDAEVTALVSYMGLDTNRASIRAWYDGYRFGNADVYNPWSVLSCLGKKGVTDVYWGNTSSNGVVGDLIRRADDTTMNEVYGLLEPGGVVWEPLDLRIVFPDLGVRPEAVWSMLYLAGYLTTDVTELPNDTDMARPLRIPNKEVAKLFRSEIIDRFRSEAGGSQRLRALHTAVTTGNATALEAELSRILGSSASYHDLTGENSYHVLMLGLLFGMQGYEDPRSNREEGHGRFDIQVRPDLTATYPAALRAPRPLVTLGLKWLKPEDAPADETKLQERLRAEANDALAQIKQKSYEGPVTAEGTVRWGIACSGKYLVALAERG